MTVEQYIFTKVGEYKEGLVVYPNQNIIDHWLNSTLVQRLALHNDKEKGDTYLEYDWYKDGLWVGLMLHPCYPLTAIHNFYLGCLLKDGGMHGLHFTWGDRGTYYYLYDRASGSRTQDLKNEPDVDWKKLRNVKQADFSKALTRVCKDPSTGKLSFACRLVPAPFSPIAQVSLTEEFHEDSTLVLDTSYALNTRTFEYIITEAKKLLDDSKKPAERAEEFCENLQIAFSSYFPMA